MCLDLVVLVCDVGLAIVCFAGRFSWIVVSVVCLVGLVGGWFWWFLVALGYCLWALLWSVAICVVAGLLKVASRFCFGFTE